MTKRLAGKVAIVVGAGQTPGETIGNGRAISILFARQGARVMLVDRCIESANDTNSLIEKEGGESFAFQADIVSQDDCRRMAEECVAHFGRIDVLGIKKDDLIKMRNQAVPLKGGMGDAWDTAYAALFLASDEARFITAAILPVDGGQCAKIG